MPKFKAYYSISSYGEMWFEADSDEHAQELIDQVQEGDTEIENLPNLTTSGEHGIIIDKLTSKK